jgi:hypothetical protein
MGRRVIPDRTAIGWKKRRRSITGLERYCGPKKERTPSMIHRIPAMRKGGQTYSYQAFVCLPLMDSDAGSRHRENGAIQECDPSIEGTCLAMKNSGTRHSHNKACSALRPKNCMNGRVQKREPPLVYHVSTDFSVLRQWNVRVRLFHPRLAANSISV